MNRRAQHDIARKLKVLNYAKEIGNIAKTCRYFGICRESFYVIKVTEGLKNNQIFACRLSEVRALTINYINSLGFLRQFNLQKLYRF